MKRQTHFWLHLVLGAVIVAAALFALTFGAGL